MCWPVRHDNIQGSIQWGGGRGEASPKTSSFPPVYSCDCTVVVIVLPCGFPQNPDGLHRGTCVYIPGYSSLHIEVHVCV